MRDPALLAGEDPDRGEVAGLAAVEPVRRSAWNGKKVARDADHLEDAVADMQIEGAAPVGEITDFVLIMGVLGDELLAQRRPVRVVRLDADDIGGGIAPLGLQPVDLGRVGGQNSAEVAPGGSGCNASQRSNRAPTAASWLEITPTSAVSRRTLLGLAAE